MSASRPRATSGSPSATTSTGFRDEHFDANRYTADGPYVRFRFKADQDTFKDLDLSRLA